MGTTRARGTVAGYELSPWMGAGWPTFPSEDEGEGMPLRLFKLAEEEMSPAFVVVAHFCRN